MKARHVWFVMAFVAGIGVFAEVVANDGVMWGLHSLMNGLRDGTYLTAMLLTALVVTLVFTD